VGYGSSEGAADQGDRREGSGQVQQRNHCCMVHLFSLLNTLNIEQLVKIVIQNMNTEIKTNSYIIFSFQILLLWCLLPLTHILPKILSSIL